MKITHWGRLIVISLTLLLAGCFQQAGESLQPASDTIAPQVVNTQPALAETVPPATITPATGSADDTTELPITIFAPPTATPVAPSSTPTQPGADDSDESTPAPSFITPGVQLGPELDTATPIGILSTTATPSGLVTPTALSNTDDTGAPVSGGACTHTVSPGENLYRIAINNGTTVDAMRQANPSLIGANPILQPGQVLQIPNCAPDTAAQPPAPETVPDTAITPPPVPQPTDVVAPPDVTGQQTYTVQRGDTLFAIALRFNTTIAAIVEANQLANPDRLELGQVLVIPANP